jgi:hypothetical protein
MLIACTHIIHAQISGCTDPLANNYNPAATINDGTCTYPPSSISPSRSINLPSIINETSGLVIDGDSVWTHNDDADINLYRFSIKDIGYSAFPLKGAKNIEWEDMSSDEVYFYLGDFGNNSAGNRTDLRILRVKKTDVLKGSMTFDTIRFAYEDQIISGSQAANTTDFDCEAIAVIGDSIVVFSKMWTTQKSVIYTFPKQPGSYIAKKKATLDIGGLITGASAIPNKQLILLCGYSRLLQPFLYLLYDFPGTEYHAGNKRKVSLNIPFHQVEGIATSNGLMAYCTNEKLVQSFLEINPAFHSLDLTNILKQYLQGGNVNIAHEDQKHEIQMTNNRDHTIISVHPRLIGTPYRLLTLQGEHVADDIIKSATFTLDTNNLPSGYYLLQCSTILQSICIVR